MNDEFSTFHFSRFVSRKEGSVDPCFVPPKPAVVPEKEELMRNQVLVGPPFLPVILLFQKQKTGERILADARAIEESGFISIDVIIRLKQSCISFARKEAPVRRIEHISMEPSIIAIFMKESRKAEENPVQAYEKRRISVRSV